MLIALMPTFNEGSRYLKESLEHLAPHVDSIVVYDDRSTDDTVEIAKEWTSFVFVRCEDRPSFRQHEGQFRQDAWRAMESVLWPSDQKDWILAIDADELLHNAESLPTLMDDRQIDVYGMTFYHMWNETQYRIDKAWKPGIFTRLYRYYNGGEFAQRALACGSTPTYVSNMVRRGIRFQPMTRLRMQHMGYARDEDKQMKHDRYMDLDGGKFHSLSHLESIIDEKPELVDWIP